MKTKQYLLLACTGLLLAGCGEWKKDPLEGVDDRFQKGIPVPTKPDLTRPVESDAVRIQGPDFLSIAEGQVQEAEIVGRILIEDYDLSVSISNLEDFPGATYDQTTGLFSWAPPHGFVQSYSTDIWVDRKLIVTAEATQEDQPTLVGSKEVAIRVWREFTAPEVTRVDKPVESLREGKFHDFTIYVDDRDAHPSDRETWPQVTLHSPVPSKNLAGLFIHLRTQHRTATTYSIHLRLDLRGIELTGSVESARVEVTPRGRYGKAGTAHRVNFDIFTSFTAPVSTWGESVSATPGQTLRYNFLVMDPKQEASIMIDKTGNVPAGAELNCTSLTISTLNCALVWTPAQTDLGWKTIELHVRSTNSNGRDTERLLTRLPLALVVKAGGN